MKTILVTGATSGIGLAAAQQLAGDGCRLVLVGRDRDRLSRAADAVRGAGAQAETFEGDFADLASVRALAEQVSQQVDRLDVLVNNAGTVFARRTETVDGIESTFAVNHLAGFLLTELLKDHLIGSAPARIVFTASTTHYQGSMDFGDLGYRHGYSVLRAYSRSKLANVIYARSLARELNGTGVTVNALHPGTVATGIWGHAPRFARPLLSVASRFMTSPADAAGKITFLVNSPDVAGITGEYFEKNRRKQPSRLARDDELGARLRVESARLVELSD